MSRKHTTVHGLLLHVTQSIRGRLAFNTCIGSYSLRSFVVKMSKELRIIGRFRPPAYVFQRLKITSKSKEYNIV